MDGRGVGDEPYHVSHGSGRPIVVLHGGGVDHREAEACFEPSLAAYGGLRRIYPDLPGTGRTAAPSWLESADDVLEVLIGFVERLADPEPVLLAGHSAGGYYARGLAARRPDLVAGLALVCPLLDRVRDVPVHRPSPADEDLGDEAFRGYFISQTPAMLQRYERFVVPAMAVVDPAAAERIGSRWQLTVPPGPGYGGPALVVAGRLDSTVGYAAATDLLEELPRTTLAVLDGTGHALPHERPDALAALLVEWLDRCAGDRLSASAAPTPGEARAAG